MTVISAAFDVLLVATVLWTAVRALEAEDLVLAVSLFIVFGLLMTLAWVRLGAPDIALAEAGIGTGFSGALLFAALARLRRVKDDSPPQSVAAAQAARSDAAAVAAAHAARSDD